MRRARLTQAGWDQDLVVEAREEPLPAPVRDTVLVEVEACGLRGRLVLVPRAG